MCTWLTLACVSLVTKYHVLMLAVILSAVVHEPMLVTVQDYYICWTKRVSMRVSIRSVISFPDLPLVWDGTTSPDDLS